MFLIRICSPTYRRNADNGEKAYIGRLNDYDRVSDILELMRARHRWGLKEFIEHMVTDEPMRPGVMNTRNWRVKGLHDALELDNVIIALDQYKFTL